MTRFPSSARGLGGPYARFLVRARYFVILAWLVVAGFGVKYGLLFFGQTHFHLAPPTGTASFYSHRNFTYAFPAFPPWAAVGPVVFEIAIVDGHAGADVRTDPPVAAPNTPCVARVRFVRRPNANVSS